MDAPRIDYDEIAPTYNRRFVNQQPGGTRAVLAGLASSCDARKIMEIGCGTAHWLTALREELGDEPQLFGLDLSAGMLAQVSQRSETIHLMQAMAECLPVRDESLDLIYCVNAIHHFEDTRRCIQEARRALQPAGALAVIGTNPRGRGNDWYVYDFFPGTYQRDLERFPSWGAIVDWAVESGFEQIEWRLGEWIHDPKIGREVLEDPFLEKNATSQLALLNDQEYAAGIERIQQAILQAERLNEVRVFQCDIHLYILIATTPRR
jgi:SAM-dependent methyltransferase